MSPRSLTAWHDEKRPNVEFRFTLNSIRIRHIRLRSLAPAVFYQDSMSAQCVQRQALRMLEIQTNNNILSDTVMVAGT